MRNVIMSAFFFVILCDVSCAQIAKGGGFGVKIPDFPKPPSVVTIDILNKDDVKEVIDKKNEFLYGKIVGITSEAASIQSQINLNSAKIVRDNFGDEWANAYISLFSSQRVQGELIATAGKYIGKCLKDGNCDLNQILAAPLAASLRDAYKVYIFQSQPLHGNIISILSKNTSINVLNQSRIVVGSTPNITVPGFLNSAYEISGSGNAVTIGNLMIFSRQLNFDNICDWVWLSHELRHVEQYLSYSENILESIDGFSVNYVNHFNSIEEDARKVGKKRIFELSPLAEVCPG